MFQKNLWKNNSVANDQNKIKEFINSNNELATNDTEIANEFNNTLMKCASVFTKMLKIIFSSTEPEIIFKTIIKAVFSQKGLS